MARQSLNRRNFFGMITKGGAAALVASTGMLISSPATYAATTLQTSGEFVLPPLPYGYEALEPHIDTETMNLHHTRHHAAAVTGLNNALRDYPEWRGKTVVEILARINEVPEAIRTTVRNAGGSHLNHSIFWATMGPGGGGQPVGMLSDGINATFGDFASFRARMTDTALRIFGSGWAWLVLSSAGSLQVISRPNQDAPVMDGHAALVGIDMWEHAHYLKYRNRRNEYVEAWWNTINWESVALRYDQARTAMK
jgi:Fe-Mn family superoxide dismutase